MDTPQQIVEHASKYNDNAWKEYSLQELGNFVHLLHKRSTHRKDADKKRKDLQDARNYLAMMDAWLKEE